MDPKTKKPLCVYAVAIMVSACKSKTVYNTFTRISYYNNSLTKVYVSSTTPDEELIPADEAKQAECSLILVFLLAGILALSFEKRNCLAIWMSNQPNLKSIPKRRIDVVEMKEKNWKTERLSKGKERNGNLRKQVWIWIIMDGSGWKGKIFNF